MFMTFSIVACDLEEQTWGVAVASKFPAVGAVVPWAQAESRRGGNPVICKYLLRPAWAGIDGDRSIGAGNTRPIVGR